MAEEKKKKKQKNYGKLALIGALVGLICVGLISLLRENTEFIEKLEKQSLNLRFKARPPIETSDRIGYINLDNKSCDLVGSWPWDRHYHVVLTRTLKFYDVTSAGYDVFFTEPMNAVINDLSEGGKKVDYNDLDSLSKRTFRIYDDELRDALRESEMIYLGEFMQSPEQVNIEETDEEIKKYITNSQSEWDELKTNSHQVAAGNAFKTTDFFKTGINKTVEIASPIPLLGKEAKGIGFEQIIPDKVTGAVYEYPMFLEYDGDIYPALGMYIATNILGVDLSQTDGTQGKEITFYAKNGYKDFNPGPFSAPINEDTRLLMNWSGPFFDTFYHISYIQLSYYYAYNESKAFVSRLKPTKKTIQETLIKLKSFLITENLVVKEQIDDIVRNVALSYLVTHAENKTRAEIITMLEEILNNAKKLTYEDGQTKNGIATHITDSILFAKHVLKTANEEDIKYCADNQTKPIYLDFRPELLAGNFISLDEKHKKEIIRNILVFKRDNRIADVSPLYFPARMESHVDGKAVDISPTMLKDKIFMIGLEGEGTIDLNPQPYEESCAMVALHANAINTFLTRQFLQFENKAEGYVYTFLLAILVGIFSHVFGTRISILATLSAILGFSYYSYHQFATNGVWITTVQILLSIALTFFISEGLQLYLAYREKQKVKGMFGKMVSPDVLKVMSENPDMFSLTGKRQACTSYFSSMEGFADITKGVTPGEMIGLLGEYLTPASQIITSYNGYIDKYEGHIIMADFGVPILQDTHMQQCLFSCVEQQLDMQAFRTYVYARYGKHVNTSMGVNAGFVSAGNMGSDKKMQYTIMGDTVNTAARFRPANWIYDNLGSIIIGESTYPLVKDYVQVRTLDKLLLKGKLKPVNIYEVMGWDPDVYMSIRSGVDISENLKVCWAKHCPPEKIYGYALFWQKQYERTNHAITNDLNNFFQSKIGHSAEMAEALVKQQIVNNYSNFRSQEAIVTDVTGKPFGDIESGDWDKRLKSWNTILIEQTQILDEKRRGHPEIDKLLRDLIEVKDKVEALEERLSMEVDIDAQLQKTWSNVQEFVSGAFENCNDDFNGKYKALYSDYELEALGICNKVSSKMLEYHELLAVIGSKTENQVKLTESYEKGLQAQWNRDWDIAIKEFEEALSYIPEDKPSRSFIDRMIAFQEKPPAASWQGEFKQTKK